MKTYADYLAKPSAKLDQLVRILQHHLAKDGAPGMTEEEVSEPLDQQQPRRPPPQEQQVVGSLDPDKIIVYSYFPSSFWLIKLVSHWLSQI